MLDIIAIYTMYNTMYRMPYIWKFFKTHANTRVAFALQVFDIMFIYFSKKPFLIQFAIKCYHMPFFAKTIHFFDCFLSLFHNVDTLINIVYTDTQLSQLIEYL